MDNLSNRIIKNLYILLFILIIGCNGSPKSEVIICPPDRLTNIGYPKKIDNLKNDSLYIIRSEKDLSNINIKDLEKINFAEYSLLLAKGSVPNAIVGIKGDLLPNGDNYSYNVSIVGLSNNDYTGVNEWELATLIYPALPVGDSVEFHIGVNNKEIVDEDDSNELPIIHYPIYPKIDFDLDEWESIYIIRSIEELSKYFNVKEIPEIDFSKYSLLLTQGMESSHIEGFKRRFIKDDKDNYILNIDISLPIFHMYTSPTVWKLAILVPILPNNAKIELDINVSEKIRYR